MLLLIEPKGSGFWAGQEKVMRKFINASDDYTDTFKEWLEAHNEKDIDKSFII